MVENGEIGIFSLNGEAYIKKLHDDKNGVFLISLNEKYPPIPVDEMTALMYWEKWLERIIQVKSRNTYNKQVRILGHHFLYPLLYQICMKVGVYYGGR